MADPQLPALSGRGARQNPKNRFERLEVVSDPSEHDPEAPRPRTVFLKDTSRSIISYNQSPDIPYNASLNPYRGCEHGCAYCYARPTHEYLGFSAGLDFETKILVKTDAPELLRQALMAKRWQPQVLALSGVTDPYQPVERKLELTRRCLRVLAQFRNPVSVITKNHLVIRDIDILKELAAHKAASVALSITTLDENLRRTLEPRTSSASRRLGAVAALAEAGVPVGVMLAPIIPGLNDHEIPALVKAAVQAGASWASYGLVHLPYGTKQLLEDWLSTHRPGRKDKVLNRIRAMRGGKLNDPRFFHRMGGTGPFAEGIQGLFGVACRQAGLPKGRRLKLSTQSFIRPGVTQPGLFDTHGRPEP